MKPKTDKNPKGSGAPKREGTEVLFRRVPKSIFKNISEYVDKSVEAHKAKSSLK